METSNILKKNIVAMCSVTVIDVLIHLTMFFLFFAVYNIGITDMPGQFILFAVGVNVIFMLYLLIEQIHNMYRLKKGMMLSDRFVKRVKLIVIVRWLKYIPVIFLLIVVTGYFGVWVIVGAIGSLFSEQRWVLVVLIADCLSVFVYNKLKNTIVTTMMTYHKSLGGNNDKT